MKRRYFTEEEDNFIREHMDKSSSWIGERLNRNQSVITRRRLLLELREAGTKTTFSDSIRSEVLEMYKQDYYTHEIAESVGITIAMVRSIIGTALSEGTVKKRGGVKLDINEMPQGQGKTADNMIYAIMRGERTLAEGNVKEIAEQLGVSLQTVKFMLSPSYIKRAQGTNKRYPVFLYDENELEDE